MATIIENNDSLPNRSVLVNQDRDSGAGWAVAILVLVALIVGGAFWYMRYYNAPASTGSTVQVNLPSSGYAPANNTGSPSTQSSAQPTTQPSTQSNTQSGTQTPSPATTPAPTGTR